MTMKTDQSIAHFLIFVTAGLSLQSTTVYANDGINTYGFAGVLLIVFFTFCLISVMINIGGWIQARAELAKERARRMSLENDKLEIEIDSLRAASTRID